MRRCCQEHVAQQLTATLLARVGKFRLRWDRPGKNSLTGLAHEMHLRLKMLLKLLRFQAGIGEGPPTRATPAELRYRALALPQHPCRSSYVRPASSRQPEVDRPEEALPAQGQDRRRHTFEPVLPPGHSWDDEGNKSSQCPKHGQCVSAFQKPTATRVAGLYAWNQLGRKVRKGERGIRILAPVVGIRRKKDSEAEKDIRTQNQAVLVGFRSAYVFDRLSRDFRPAWPATVRRRRARGLHACASMAAATSSLNSLARCKAVWMRTSSSSRAAICPAGSLCPLAAFRLR